MIDHKSRIDKRMYDKRVDNIILFFATVGIFVLIVVIAGAVGWVWNIVKLVGADFDPLTGIVILRCIGVIIAPIGAVLGYIN